MRAQADPWLQKQWSSLESESLLNLTADARRVLRREWFDIATSDSPDIGEHYRAVVRARWHVEERAQSLRSAEYDDDAINLKATLYSRLCLRVRSLGAMCRIAESQGISPPDKKLGDLGRAKRLQCPKWWTRQLRVARSRLAENALRELGTIHRQAGVYCSDSALWRRKSQRTRHRNFLSEIVAINSLGDQLSMLDIVDASLSNKALRRAELMTRIRGFEEIAEAEGHSAEFLTMTAPSRFHARLSNGRRNPKYVNGNDPRASQRFLCECWSRIRAQLSRENILIYGFRIAEPHHDATTHWHLLLFVERTHVPRLRTICQNYLLADTGDEPGARQHRFKAVSIDPARGRAAGYVAKYVAKNIDGFEVGQDFEADDADAADTSARVDAWASIWGIRQFQQIGGPPVGVWRECRRVQDAVPDELLEEVRAAADRGDWQAFVDALGGISCGRSVPVVVEKETTDELNAYGEVKGESVVGVRHGEFVVRTRTEVWKFLSIKNLESPWTCVNNCTGGRVPDASSASRLKRARAVAPSRAPPASLPHV